MKIQLERQACQISLIGFPFYCKLGIFEASPILHTCQQARCLQYQTVSYRSLREYQRILYRFLCLIEGRLWNKCYRCVHAYKLKRFICEQDTIKKHSNAGSMTSFLFYTRLCGKNFLTQHGPWLISFTKWSAITEMAQGPASV